MQREKISLELPAKCDYVKIARFTASVIANSVGFDVEEIDDIKVALSEACNNAVTHGKTNTKSDNFKIDFSVDEDNNRLVIEVSDSGSGFKINDYVEPDLENPKESGLGIYIMKALMDEVEVKSEDSGGTKVTLIKKLQ